MSAASGAIASTTRFLLSVNRIFNARFRIVIDIAANGEIGTGTTGWQRDRGCLHHRAGVE
jgi:hypothetical protein